MDIELVGNDAGRLAPDLLAWLRHEQIAGTRLTQKRADLPTGAMGAELLPIITAIMASPVIVEVVRSIQTWIQAKRPKIKVIVRLPSGAAVEIDSENIKDIDQQVAKALAHVKSA